MLSVRIEGVKYYKYSCDYCTLECVESKSKMKPYGWVILEEVEDDEGCIIQDKKHFCSPYHLKMWQDKFT